MPRLSDHHRFASASRDKRGFKCGSCVCHIPTPGGPFEAVCSDDGRGCYPTRAACNKRAAKMSLSPAPGVVPATSGADGEAPATGTLFDTEETRDGSVRRIERGEQA
jgi:hypothetical protein